MNQKHRSALTSKHLLITPSPTPFSQSSSDGPSPTKKPRFNARSSSRARSVATPGPTFSTQTFFTDEAGEGIVNLHEARRASSSRVLNIWSQLAERYSRPLAEDDIVDLRTQKIIQDRNVLRSAQGKYKIGYFGDQDQSPREGTETPTEEGDEESSDDELDAFAPGADISDELELVRITKAKEREAQMDPADADDLREFLEAENRRREAHGSEGEYVEQEEEAERMEEEDQDLGDGEDGFLTDEFEDGLEDGSPASSEPAPKLKVRRPSMAKETPSSQSGDISSSEDELGKWGDLDLDDLDAGRVIELPVAQPLPSPSPIPTKPKRGRPRKDSQIPAAGISMPPPSHLKSQLKNTLGRQLSHFQLHTPPRSSSSVTGNTPDASALQPSTSHTIGTSSPSPPLRSKSKSRSQSKARSKPTETVAQETDAKPVAPMKNVSKLSSKPKQVAMASATKPMSSIESKSETPATPRTRSLTKSRSKILKAKSPSSDVIEISDDDDTKSNSRVGKVKASDKGKAKAKNQGDFSLRAKSKPAVVDSESDDPMTLVSSSPHGRAGHRDTDSASASGSEKNRIVTPLPDWKHGSPSTPPKARFRKRKRIPSSSVEADPEPTVNQNSSRREMTPEAQMDLSAASPDIDIIDFRRNAYEPHERELSPVPKSRGKHQGTASFENVVHEDPDSEPISPFRITRRASSISRTRVRSTPVPIAGSRTDTRHYPYSETATPHHTRHSTSNHTEHPSHNFHTASSMPPPQYPAMAPTQGPQAQFLLAQAMQHLSYIMSASGHGQNHLHPNKEQPWPPQGLGSMPQYTFGSHNPDWATYATPTHLRHRHPSEMYDSSLAGPLLYTTPAHPHPYPRAYTPSYSSATLPPSSPDQSPPSSPRTSVVDVPLPRAPSLARGRSKSRGRRVSFRIDDDRPHGLDEHDRRSLRMEESDDLVQDDTVPSSPLSKRGRSKSSKRDSSSAPPPISPSPDREIQRTKTKDKMKAVTIDTPTNQPDPDRGQSHSNSKGRFERGQTPGPPSTAPSTRSRSISRKDKRS